MRLGIALALAMTLSTALPAAGADTAKNGVWTLIVENDLFYGSDQNYTNGVALAWVPSPKPAPDWAVGFARSLPWFPDAGEVRHGYVLGQNIYTSRDISVPDSPLDDRPYAGWLYGAIGLAVETSEQSDQLSLAVGIVGPASLAEQSQKAIHRITGSLEPQGWDTQLRNEPGVVLTYQRRWRGLAEAAQTRIWEP